jgi:seryl-tRNA synthetase
VRPRFSTQVTPENADAEADSLLGDAEALLQALELPYRAVQLCAGDVGFSAQRCVDLEVWLPGQQEYREVSSCSLMGDFQARRMNLRYKPAPSPEDKKPRPRFPCTMNGSGLAVGRALVAVLENHQNDDGSVSVPAALRPYLQGAEVLSK